MRIEDKPAFTQLIAATMAIYERQMTTSVVDVFFSALSQYDLVTVREALNRHMQDPESGRFAPKPADVIRQVVTAKASDGRPGRDEAWSIALRAQDEAETVMVTEEILGALEVAQPLLQIRDKVAARLAFVEAYDRLVGEKRAAGVSFEWQVSLGTDKSKRVSAIERAKVSGLLPGPKAELMLEDLRETPISADGLAVVALLGTDRKQGGELTTDELRSRWQDLRRSLTDQKRSRINERSKTMREAEEELKAHAEKTESIQQGESK